MASNFFLNRTAIACLFLLAILLAVAGILFQKRNEFSGKIALLGLGKYDKDEIVIVKEEIERFYGFSVTVLPTQDIPALAFYEPRKRYKAAKILDFIRREKPGDHDKIIALVQSDISAETKRSNDWGIMGLAHLGGVCGVVSTFRLKKDNPIKAKLKERLSKVALHEVGHTLGLRHCQFSEWCIMKDANGSIKTIDMERLELCQQCWSEIDYTRN